MDKINILAIDTSSNELKIGLSINGKDTYSMLNKEFKHIETILPQVQKCLSRINKDKKELKYVAVCTGPGSFTGIRIGITTALAISYARGIRCFGFSVFDLYKYLFRDEKNKIVIPIIDAKKNRYYCSFIEFGQPIKMLDICISEIIERIKKNNNRKRIVFVGKDFKYIKNQIEEHFDFEEEYPNGYGALDILSFAMNYVYNNKELNVPTPIYLRKSEAEIALIKNKE